MKTLLVGATGALGRRIAAKLLARNHTLYALVRSPQAADELARQRAFPVTGDLKDRLSLMSACRNMDAIVTTANSVRRPAPDTIESVDIQGACNLIDAAVKCGVKRFVYMSAHHASMNHPAAILAAKAYVEAYLRCSGLDYVILAPNLFMDVWAETIVGRAAREKEAVVLPGRGLRKHSMVAAEDVAEITVRSMADINAENTTIQIGGPTPVSWKDVIGAYERVTGTTITVRVDNELSEFPSQTAAMLRALETFDSPIDMTSITSRYDLRLTSIDTYAARSVSCHDMADRR